MNYTEIIRLLDAGYSREEILSMNDKPEETETKPEEVETKPEEAKNNEMSELVKEMRDMFADMKKEFTAFNIMSSHMPTDSERTSEDIIANIINPTKAENNKGV